MSRVTAVGLAGQRILHKAVENQGLMLTERIHHRGRGVRYQQHIGFLDVLESSNRGPVEPEPLRERILTDDLRGQRVVLHEPRKVAEAEIDELDTFVGYVSEHFFRGRQRRSFLAAIRKIIAVEGGYVAARAPFTFRQTAGLSPTYPVRSPGRRYASRPYVAEGGS